MLGLQTTVAYDRLQQNEAVACLCDTLTVMPLTTRFDVVLTTVCIASGSWPILLGPVHADDMTAAQRSFDASLTKCHMAQLELAVSLKAAEGQLLLMTKELEVLKVDAHRDQVPLIQASIEGTYLAEV